jgi:CHAT domain-containing protein
MDRGGPAASELWLEIDIAQAGQELSATARGGQNQQPPAHMLGARFTPETVLQFAEWVKEAASRAASLKQCLPEGQALREAQELYQALFQPGLKEVLDRLQGAAGSEPILLRLNPKSPALKAIPWEALCGPGSEFDFLGTSPGVLLARGVESLKAWQPREVKGAVRLLVISPSDEGAPDRLRAMLHESIQAGEIEWLEPLTGPFASKDGVQDRLRREPIPHILHFIGHGGLDEGSPSLQMASRVGEDPGFKVELLAMELESAFRNDLRLIVLEACEGAQPGGLVSAAERLAQTGAGAVVAHLWPVKADVARRCSVAFYRSLTQGAVQRGDVARSLHDARRTILVNYQGSAEAFSPVLYLRGRESALFDFRRRKVAPPSAPAQVPPLASTDPAVRGLLELIQKPCTLVLGDHLQVDAWSEAVETFRRKLLSDLQPTPWATSEALPLGSLSQRYMQQFGAKRLNTEFQTLFRQALPALPLVEALARRLSPGFHVTLLRLPVLDLALAELRPGLGLYVIQPSQEDKEAPLILRRTEARSWETLGAFPDSFDPSRDVALLRLYRGYQPDQGFDAPLLTEDDYLLEVRDLRDVLPVDLAAYVQKELLHRPALLMGMSLRSWDHRHVLHSLFQRQQPPPGSTVLLEPGDVEAEAWKKGRGLSVGAHSQSPSVVQVASEALARMLGAPEPGGRP